MTEHGVTEFGFEPGAFGGHDAAGIGDGHKVFNAGGKHGECASVLAAVDPVLEFRCAADAAYEIDAIAGARVVDTKNWVEDVFLEQGDVEFFDGVGGCSEPGPEIQPIPTTAEVEAQFVFAAGLGGALWINDKDSV